MQRLLPVVLCLTARRGATGPGAGAIGRAGPDAQGRHRGRGDEGSLLETHVFDKPPELRRTEASKYRIGEDEYDIRVRLAPEARDSLDTLKNLTVTDEDGLQIPLRSIVELETGVGPGSIKRVDLRRVVTIEGDVVRASGRTEDSVRAEVAARLEDLQLPPGYRWEFAGADEEQAAAQAFLQRSFVIAVLLITLVLVTQFNNLVMPITVMLSVVLSLIGVLWGLIVTGTPFGLIMTGVGVISLAGIVVNNAIVLGDFIQQLRARGVEKTRAVVRAGACASGQSCSRR